MIYHSYKHKAAIIAMMLSVASIASKAQTIARPQPIWWFGESGAVNINQFRGTTQDLNSSVSVPTAFHKGGGVKPYLSLLTEYRPNKRWGGMLNVAYDNRGGKFKEVMAPCNCPANLSTNLSYVSIEPSVRLAPIPSSSFYVFAGPTLSFNVRKSFEYTQDKQADKTGDWSDIRNSMLSAQAGAGIDIPVSAKTSLTQFTVSPFASFQTDFGHDPRSVESWSLYTVRAGVAFKFGKGRKDGVTTNATPSTATVKTVDFSVRAPKAVPVNRQVKETFALRNSVFFNEGSTEIPTRYVQLNKSQATSFKEEGLQQSQPKDLSNGRSARQLSVYHNILNIMGDRMRANPASTIALTGASIDQPAEGKEMAENIKQYLVAVFGISPARITTVGRSKPIIPSEQPGATKELALLREGDRRVDIESASPELLLQVGGSASPFLKPVQIKAVQQDPLDSHVIFNAGNANSLLKSWTVDVTDDKGKVQHYGPFTNDQASIPGKTILGNNEKGNYRIAMNGVTKAGQTIRKETSLSLVKAADPKTEGLRYSILFDFDKSKSIASYEKFLATEVTPLIPANATVIIHGHTDVIGDDKYNHTLSHERAMSVQKIIENALLKAGKKGVKFQSYGFGEDPEMTPFENKLPEERFYNRTVIIDIVPAQ